MTEVNYRGAQSYTISLDSVDLTFLSQYVHTPNAEKIPLWTRNCLDGESEYCQVQIVSQDGNGGCYSEPSDTYKCHICNVHVPIMCSQEHNDSEQHETIKNIFEKVFERLSKQMNLSIISNEKDIDKDVYYCVPCSKIIKIENKRKHKSSDYHVKSKRVSNIVNDFYKMFKENNGYDDDDNDDDENVLNDVRSGEETDLEPDHVESYKANNNYDTDNKNLKACSNGVLIMDSDDDSDDPSPIANNLMTIAAASNIDPSNDEKKESFEEYLKEMIKKYNLRVNLPAIDGEYITIVAPNGGKVKVSREHFQSYRQLKNSVYCQVCKMWISQDSKPHNVTENHVRNIFKPINENFARTVDIVSSHCVPCNEVVLTDSNHHTLNDNHKKIIKDTHTPKTFCEDCNIYIDTHNFPSHINSKKHLDGLMKQNSIHNNGNDGSCFCTICKVTMPKSSVKYHINSKRHIALKTSDSIEINNKDKDSIEISNKSNDTSEISNKTNNTSIVNHKTNDSPAIGICVKINESEYCETCKVKVPRGGMKIHVDGKPHRTALSKLCSENKNDIKPKENKEQIGAKPDSLARGGSSASPNTQYDSSASTSTLSSQSNATDYGDEKVKAYYDLVEVTDDTKTTIRCKICSVNIVFVKRSIIEHMEGKNHVENPNKEKAKKTKSDIYSKLLLYTDDANARANCSICDVNMAYIERCIIEHMEGRNHGANANKEKAIKEKIKEYSKLRQYTDDVKTKVESEICNVAENANREKANKEKMREYSKLLLHTNDAKTKVKCEICDVEVPFLQRNIIEHMEGKNHAEKANKEKMEEYSKLLLYTDDAKTKVKCEICDVEVPFLQRNIIEHMEGKNHAENANKEKANKEKMEEYSKLLLYTDDAKTKVKCEICDVEVPFLQRNIIEHMEGKNHAENANKEKANKEKMEEYSKLLLYTDDAKTKVKCEICNVDVPFLQRNIIEHMEGRNHAKNANREKANEEKMEEYSKLLLYTNDAKTKVKCEICDVEVPFLQRNIIGHMEGKNHAENANRQDKANKEKMEEYSKLLLFTDDSKTKVRCEICDVDFPYVQRDIIEHMEGRNHEAAKNELIQFHLLTEESSGYVCECCEIHTTDYFKHINSRTHTQTLLVKFNIDKNEMRKYVYDEDVNDPVARLYREQYRNLMKYNNMFKINDTSYYCGICQIKLGRINEIDHVLGERHTLRVEELNKYTLKTFLTT